ncbi:MAG: TonB-dependent receptor [Xanthomonadales bacterium]|nr:TonB-dependent receptor [Xanthomonadales bacterium]
MFKNITILVFCTLIVQNSAVAQDVDEKDGAIDSTQEQQVENNSTDSQNETGTTNSNETDGGSVEMAPLMVTGSRIQAANIVSIIPTQTIGQLEIASSGSIDLGEILEEIPGVYLGVSPAGSLLSTVNAGLSVISLRGLGTTRTLTLINGRRAVSNSGFAQRVDTATIPSGFVDYIDITTGGASAAYGSDAIAGVANIILKNDFVGFKFGSRYEDSDEGGRETTSANVIWGTDFSDSRGNIMIGATWEAKNELKATDRAYAASTLEIDLETGEFSPNLSSFLPGGRFENGDAWNIDGVWQNDQPGYCIDDGRVPACDDYQEALDGYDFRPLSLLFPERDRFSMMMNGKFDLTDTVTASAMVNYSETDTRTSRASAISNDASTFGPFDNLQRIGDINPNNPFIPPAVLETLSGTVDWRRRFTELGPRETISNRKTTRLSLSLDGAFNYNWRWSGNVGYGVYKHDQNKVNEVNRQNIQFALDVEDDPTNPGGYRCVNEGARGNGCVPLNVFGVGSITPEAADYIRHTVLVDQKLTQTTASLVVNGSLWELPAGPLSSAFGVDYRRETQVAIGDPITNAGLTSSSSLLDVDASFDVAEAFAEVAIPVLADKTGVHALDLSAALRLANYSTIGTVSSWNFGISYAPIEDLRFRAQISQAQRAPNITELFSALRSDFDSFNDPCDGVTASTTGTVAENCRMNPGIAGIIASEGEFIQLGTQIFGPSMGNVNLQEETADTVTYGFVFTPQAISGFSLIVDYYKIEIEDVIGSVASQLAGDLCYNDGSTFSTNRFCSSITRDADGQVNRIVNQRENLNSRIAEGVDVSVLYDFNFPGIPGDFKSSFIYSHIITHEITFNGPDGEELNDLAGQVGRPEEEYRFKLRWDNNNYAIQYKLKYTGSVRDDNDPRPEDIFGFITFAPALVHDIYVSYSFDDSFPIRIFGGINNITNEHGPYLPDGYASGSNWNVNSNYDRVGRRFYMGFDFKW